MKELKDKYDNLKQNGTELGFQLPDINLKCQQPPNKSGPGADETNHAIQRYQVIAKNPTEYEEGSLVVHDHRLNGTQVAKQQQLNTQETLKRLMKNIFYSDDGLKAQEGGGKGVTMITNVSGKANSKVFIDPKTLIEAHPLF